ncbi:hypothetical protein FOZ61_005819 [Perkinsus olseni]|uniref:ER membrane protein complex subunit 6 n=1 Tax=Perkinsus olseni TaxID=32597 RepID=A0A7J6SX72_PEROL|nr:hypothetical protein FOZ61_005819 [Perkinsus olseni]KAF4693454.1 hypothetical protein FOZ60_010872 [Perkinsus olseni]KAF4700818.1 hypothetical protein FOZ63_000858 [Perkinsus olseni]KAF4733092.1 hypothetical protein FOZ62_000647 [Perkinsus olseni]KAF4737441.1 hypothetical protein FOZ63_030803 [Perkinsus olseni]
MSALGGGAPTSTDPTGVKPQELIQKAALANNMRLLGSCRTFSAILGGILAGIFRVEGLQYGLVLFAVVQLLGSLLLYVRLGGDGKKYFISEKDVMVGQLFTGLMGFVLMWTLVYDCVHIF